MSKMTEPRKPKEAISAAERRLVEQAEAWRKTTGKFKLTEGVTEEQYRARLLSETG